MGGALNQFQIHLNNVMSYEKREDINGNEKLGLVFKQALVHMDRTIDDLFPLLSDPREEPFVDGVRVRFSKKDSLHVVVLKLVQLTSNLRAGMLLIDHGFIYEWSVVKRLLSETIEDIMFLLAENQADNQSELHERFLQEFYLEDLDEKGNLQQKEKGARWVRRQEIRSYLSDVQKRMQGKEAPLLEKESMGVYRFGSGYVHGRAAYIMMGLYDSRKNRFRTDGRHDQELLALNLKSLGEIASLAIEASITILKQLGADEEYLSNARAVLESLDKITGLRA